MHRVPQESRQPIPVKVTDQHPEWSSGPASGLRIAVLGASGFIGSWVARLLLEAGYQPHLFCRTPNPAAWGATKPTRVIEGDLLGSAWADLAREPFDVVFNLLGYGVAHHEKDYGQAYRINAFLPARLSELPGQPFVVHVGSALEYGEVGGDLREDTVPNPTNLYGHTKLLGTYRFLDRLRSNGPRGVVVRLFMIYGPGESEPRLLPTLISACRSGRPIPMTEGAQRRDFTFVAEAAEGLIRMGLGTHGDGEIVNLATGRLTAIRDFAETAGHTLGLAPSQLQFGRLPTRAEEMQHDPVNVTRLRQLLHWTPSLTVREGIERTVHGI